MDSLVLLLQKSLCLLVLCFSFLICYAKADAAVEGTVLINGKSPIAVVDEDFVCATMDMWPPDRCDYGICSWGVASILNLDLNNVALSNAIKAFSPLMLRLGGSLQNRLIYQTERSEPCIPFVRNTSLSHLYNYTEGCMSLARWDELNSFFNRTGARFIFGINPLTGKTIQPNNTATGPWDSTNAESLFRYTVNKGYKVHGFELGNELAGYAMGPAISVDPYVSDTNTLRDVIDEIYEGVDTKPLVMAPGGIFDFDWPWFTQYIDQTRRSRSLDVITIHNYNLGDANQENLTDKILNVSVLDEGAVLYKTAQNILKSSGTSTVAWVGESGGVYRSGHDGVTNAFVCGFWYLDQLGLASTYDMKKFCRQTLVGGNYGLLNTTTFDPNPDYYSALLWHRLMGRTVLSTKFRGTKMIRAYAHCAKKSKGITLLLINIDGNNAVRAKLSFDDTEEYAEPLPCKMREEYHLTPMDGNIRSRTVLLNGKVLALNSLSAIPALEPVKVASSEPIKVDPYSIVFVHMPNIVVPACGLGLQDELSPLLVES